jgi:hypothetical protein
MQAPPPNYRPPTGASAKTWPNIYSNLKDIDFCVDQFDEITYAPYQFYLGANHEICPDVEQPIPLKPIPHPTAHFSLVLLVRILLPISR